MVGRKGAVVAAAVRVVATISINHINNIPNSFSKPTSARRCSPQRSSVRRRKLN